MPNLEWLRSFVVFAEHLNFTRAAEALHLSQPALHVQVKKLAEQLGVTLYERRGRGLALTPDGRRVLAFGRELLARCERFSDDLRGAPPSRAPVLAAGEGAFLYLLPLARLRASAPIDARVVDGEEALRAVREAEADVGVAAVDAGDLETRALAEEWTYRFLAAAHTWAITEHEAIHRISGTRIDVTVLDGSAAAPEPSTAEVRTWARAAGLSVPDRGRLRPDIWQAWRDANAST